MGEIYCWPMGVAGSLTTCRIDEAAQKFRRLIVIARWVHRGTLVLSYSFCIFFFSVANITVLGKGDRIT